jgi:hypothetical protein
LERRTKMNLNWTVADRGKWAGKHSCKLNLISLLVHANKSGEGWVVVVKGPQSKDLFIGTASSEQDAKEEAVFRARVLLQEQLDCIGGRVEPSTVCE